MKRLIISFEIPFSDEDWVGPKIEFNRWIPEDVSNAISIKDKNNIINIYADKKCVSSLEAVTEERISSWVNIGLSKFKFDVILNDIEDELADFIYGERESPKGIHHSLKPENAKYEELKQKYIDLGIYSSKIAISKLNRIISYARNIKGQYWLSEHQVEDDKLNGLNVKFRAKVKIDKGEYFRWCPSHINCITIYADDNESSITKDDWNQIAIYMQNNNRPNLVFELLANSRYLFSNTHMRSSVIEAVTALEIAVTRFGNNVNVEMLSKTLDIERIDINNIGKQIKHLGFSGSIKYLIPLLIKESELSSENLKKCYKALDVRNNLIHQGQRDVSSGLVRELLNAISLCCRILDDYTLKLVGST